MSGTGMRPTAVFCGNDAIAIGALNAARKAGVAVPDEVSIIGFDDIPIADWELIQLTTVHTPASEMAASAGRLLVERIEARPRVLEPRIRIYEPHLVMRRTLADVS